MRLSRRSTAVVSCVSLVLATAQAANTSKPQADSFARKIIVIKEHGGRTPVTARRTTVTEAEVNSWFLYHGQPLMPAGVKDPKVVAVGNGKLLGVVTVDLEDIGKQRSSGGTLDAWRYLGGKLPISLSGVLHTKAGRGHFVLERADIAGVPVPRMFVQEIVSHYTRTEDHPNGIRLDDPFELPASIKQIDVGQGQAVVVQ